MTKRNTTVLFLAVLAVLGLVVAPTVASARKRDHPDYGFCKSGAKVKDIKKCKENGGKK